MSANGTTLLGLAGIMSTAEGKECLRALNKAWARLVRAAVADMDSMHMADAFPTEENVVAHCEKNSAYWAAVKALREIGVGVDALLEER